jgi:hypothetical protein
MSFHKSLDESIGATMQSICKNVSSRFEDPNRLFDLFVEFGEVLEDFLEQLCSMLTCSFEYSHYLRLNSRYQLVRWGTICRIYGIELLRIVKHIPSDYIVQNVKVFQHLEEIVFATNYYQL